MKSYTSKRIISSATLRKYNTIYENQYNDLSKRGIINSFMTKLNNYIDADMEKEKCTPQYFLTSLAAVGSYGIYIYHGPFPKEYESDLIPIIQQYLVSKYRLKDFSGFLLEINSKNSLGSFATMKLQWNGPPTNNTAATQRRKRKDRVRKSGSTSIDKDLISRLEKIESRLNDIADTQNRIQGCDKRVEIIDKVE